MFKEFIRKLLHIFVCLSFIFIPEYFNPTISVFLIIGIYLGMLLLFKFKILSFIKDVKRVSIGEHLIFLGCFVTLILYYFLGNFLIYKYALLVLAFADSLAILGRPITNYLNLKLRHKKFIKNNGKTFIGTAIFLITTAFLAQFFKINIFSSNRLILSFFLLGFLEYKSLYGSDNLTIPIFIYVTNFLFL
jgi:hypothetical protein